MQKIKLLSLFILALLSGCTSDMKYNPGVVGAVGELYLPSDNYYVELAGGSGKYVNFSWAPTTTSDGYSPMYEVVFYSDQTAKQELMRVNAGVNTSVSVPHKSLNKVMNKAGILPEQTGRIYWSAIASRAVAESPNVPSPRVLEVKRMKGFKVAPEKLYLTGSATETGGNIDNARQFADVGEGEVFEIFTRLVGGEFTACDATTSDARKFNMSDGLINEDNSDPTPSSYSGGIYRIRVDLSTCSVDIDEIANMRWVMCIQKNDLRPLAYVGGGVWQAENLVANFNSGWTDDRYFFRAELAGQTIKIGNSTIDFGDAPANKGSYTWNTNFAPEGNADWDYAFKTIPAYKGSVGMLVNISLCMNASAQSYYHTIDYPSYEK